MADDRLIKDLPAIASLASGDFIPAQSPTSNEAGKATVSQIVAAGLPVIAYPSQVLHAGVSGSPEWAAPDVVVRNGLGSALGKTMPIDCAFGLMRNSLTISQNTEPYLASKPLLALNTTTPGAKLLGIKTSQLGDSPGGTQILIYNRHDTNEATLANMASTVDPQAKFKIATGADLTLAPGEMAMAIWDDLIEVWRVWPITRLLQSDKSFNIAQKSSIAADTFIDNSTISCMVFDTPGNPNFQAKEIYLNALIASGMIALQYSHIVTKFMAKSLTKINGGLDVQNNSKLTNLYFPELTSITNNININNNALLSSITLYSLKEAYGAVMVSNCSSITSLNLATLYTVTNGISIGVNSKLQNLTLTSLQTLGGGIQLGGNALTVTAVNTLLSKAAGLVDPGTGNPWGYQRNFYIADGTNAAPTNAAPYFAITAAQTLIARGCTVTVNGTAITTTKKTTFTIPDFDTVADRGKTLKVKADGTGLEWVA